MEYRVIRSVRKTIAIEITNGQVLIRCPLWISDARALEFAESKKQWIQEQLRKAQGRQPSFTPQERKRLTERTRKQIRERVAYFAPQVGVTYGRIAIRGQKTRWGSCSSKGNLNFNCLLVLVPPQVMDYVVVHELCHLKELNHSPRFWAEVERIIPDYCVHRKWLKDNGGKLIDRL